MIYYGIKLNFYRLIILALFVFLPAESNGPSLSPKITKILNNFVENEPWWSKTVSSETVLNLIETEQKTDAHFLRNLTTEEKNALRKAISDQIQAVQESYDSINFAIIGGLAVAGSGLMFMNTGNKVAGGSLIVIPIILKSLPYWRLNRLKQNSKKLDLLLEKSESDNNKKT